jgi:hypothetical protein
MELRATRVRIVNKVADALAEDLRAGSGMTHNQARMEIEIPQPFQLLMVGKVTWVRLDVDYIRRWYTMDLPNKCAPSEYTYSVDTAQEAIEETEDALGY